MENFDPHEPSPKVTVEMAFAIAALLDTGMKQHRIAALLHVNQGRVSEVKTGKIYPEFTRKRFKRS